MKVGPILNTLSTSVLLTCAVIVTYLFLRRELLPVAWKAVPGYLDNWRTLLAYGHVVGDTSARVNIIEFSDYECPYCRTMEPVLGRILKKYRGQVNLVRFDLPLPTHQNALEAAFAAECASHQERYNQYHSLLFEFPRLVKAREWVRLAGMAGVSDTARFHLCLDSDEASNRIERRIEIAKQFEIPGTPTFVVNGYVQVGAVEERQLEEMIERSLSGGRNKR